jgi:leucyl/phenylalanyl-tRNA---protein transferase
MSLLRQRRMTNINYISFPAVCNADQDGLLAMGGNLTVDTLVSAYRQGIFPWFNHDQPILWWSPDPRMVLIPGEIKVSRSLAKIIRQKRFRVSCNQNFKQVIRNCALRGQDSTIDNSFESDTWITQSMVKAYNALHCQGYAHSIEVWDGDQLVGGLYGLAMGQVFFGESMFSIVNDASKVALATLCCWLKQHDYQLIDCQVSSEHLLSLGAKKITRAQFMEYLSNINIQQKSINFGKDISQLSTESVINKI